MSGATKTFAAMAVVLWLASAAATIAALRGDSAALTATLGAGVPALAASVVTGVLWAQDRRRRPTMPS